MAQFSLYQECNLAATLNFLGLATFGVFLSRMGRFPFQGHWATWKCPEICSTYVYQAMGFKLSTLHGHTWCPLVTAVCVDPAKYLSKPKSANLKVVQMNSLCGLDWASHDSSH